MSSKRLIRQDGYLKKRRARYKKIIWIIAIAFLILIGILITLSRIEKFRISKIEISGNSLVESIELSKYTLEFLDGNYLWVFPKNNILLYGKKGLVDGIKNNFHRVQDVNIHLQNFNNLSVNVTERLPFALWCSGQNIEGESCYFMDKLSIIYAVAPSFSGDAYFRYYGILDGEVLGKRFMQDSYLFESLDYFMKYTDRLGLEPQYMNIKENGEYVISIFGGGQILFNDQYTLDDIAFNLEALLKSDAFASTTNFSNLDYIDLRFGNRLFYKLKSQNNNVQMPTTEYEMEDETIINE